MCQNNLLQHYLDKTFSDMRDLVLPKGKRQTGQVTNLGWHSLQTTCPLSHWKMGAHRGMDRQTGHSKTSFKSSAEMIGCLAAMI